MADKVLRVYVDARPVDDPLSASVIDAIEEAAMKVGVSFCFTS